MPRTPSAPGERPSAAAVADAVAVIRRLARSHHGDSPDVLDLRDQVRATDYEALAALRRSGGISQGEYAEGLEAFDTLSAAHDRRAALLPDTSSRSTDGDWDERAVTAPVPVPEPGERFSRLAELSREIRDAQRAIALAEESLQSAVAEARSLGASWADIAAILGITRQLAHYRFGRSERRRPKE